MRRLIVILFILIAHVSAFAVEIDRVEVSGNRRVPSEQILKHAVAAGTEFDLDQIDASIKKLYQTGLYLDVKVDMELNTELVLVYMIKEKPVINDVFFQGNDELKDKALTEKIPLKTGNNFNKKLIEATVVAIQAAYEEENFFNVEIRYEIEYRKNNSVDLVFTIEEGKEAKVEKINFYGVTGFTEKKIKKIIQTEEKGFFSWFSGSGTLKRGDLALDKERLRGLYMSNGYVRAQIAEPEVTMNEKKTKIFITFRVEEGHQYYVNKIEFKGNVHRTTEELVETTDLKKEMLFNGEMYHNDIDKITEAFTSIGYAFADVFPRTSIDDEKRLVDVMYEIEESNLVHIDSIQIIGNSKTRDRVIRREFDLVPGMKYNSLKLKASVKNVEHTGYFGKVNLVEEPVGADKMKLKIDVQEQSTGSFSIGAGYSSLDGVTGMAQVQQRNLFGLGYQLNLKSELSSKRFDIVLGFTNPWLFDWPVTFGVDVYNLHRSYLEYDKDSIGASLRLGHPIIKRKLYMNYRMAFDDIHIHKIDDDASQYIKDQNGRYKTHSFTPTLTLRSVDNPLDPSKGVKGNIFVKYAGGPLQGDTHYYKLGSELTVYHPLFYKLVGMLHGEVGYVESLNSDPIPVDQRYRLGGMNSVRGYKYGDISPKDETGYDYGGDKMVLFNAEITFPIAMQGQVKGVVFYDAGQSYDDGESYFDYGLKQSYGGGFRWFSPMGPLRFEYGRKLHPKDGETEDRWDFSVGGMF